MDLTPAFDLIVMSLRSAMVFTKCFIIHFKGFKTVIIEVISAISKSQSFFHFTFNVDLLQMYIKETEFYFSYINNAIDQFALAFIFFSFRLLNASVGLLLLWWTLSTPSASYVLHIMSTYNITLLTYGVSILRCNIHICKKIVICLGCWSIG